ncbi:cytidine deaminase [Striga asiatica]|uniref:Cytidine deaminase n=1 Tax=Striga asiatica TaxID=4170 RepID=A0A5A7R1Y7_STRAF|nr:cytidine deaminase [Striga asiatica]
MQRERVLSLQITCTNSLEQQETMISNYHVGLGSDGHVFLAANLEFPGLSLHHSVHAELFVLTSLAVHRCPSLLSLAVSFAPCGHCRQFLQEIRDSFSLQILVTGDGDRDPAQNPDFKPLPNPFGPHYLLDRGTPHLLDSTTMAWICCPKFELGMILRIWDLGSPALFFSVGMSTSVLGSCNRISDNWRETTTSAWSPLAIDRYSVDTCSRRRSLARPNPTRWIILLHKPSFFDWSFSSAAASVSNLIRANVFPGYGIGPHIAESVKQHLAPESRRAVQFLEDRQDFGLPGIFHLLEAPWGE